MRRSVSNAPLGVYDVKVLPASDGDIQQTIPAGLAMQVNDTGTGTMYVGEALPGTATSAALWRIKKIVTTGADIAITWADGNDYFDNIWTSRASLSYS